MTLAEFEALCRRVGIRAVRVWLQPSGSVDVIAQQGPEPEYTMFATYGETSLSAALHTIVLRLKGAGFE
jgi:hypothetical protein